MCARILLDITQLLLVYTKQNTQASTHAHAHARTCERWVSPVHLRQGAHNDGMLRDERGVRDVLLCKGLILNGLEYINSGVRDVLLCNWL